MGQGSTIRLFEVDRFLDSAFLPSMFFGWMKLVDVADVLQEAGDADSPDPRCIWNFPSFLHFHIHWLVSLKLRNAISLLLKQTIGGMG